MKQRYQKLCSATIKSRFNFRVSNLNVRNPFFTRRDFLLPEKCRSNELDFVSSSGGVIRCIVLGIDVSPFFGSSGRSDYLNSVDNKRLKSFGVVINAAKYYLGISPKVLLEISIM